MSSLAACPLGGDAAPVPRAEYGCHGVQGPAESLPQTLVVFWFRLERFPRGDGELLVMPRPDVVYLWPKTG
ncbi:hypothetical protein [Streptomyces rhizosphaericus]|uniref:hypothetical protein n=1 Tax=Streptomyces rhizosphaericus TaxID=114699 RepID=UPI00117FF4B2|nr:hypothetical protein [Streptomyces rhizosphaericus]